MRPGLGSPARQGKSEHEVIVLPLTPVAGKKLVGVNTDRHLDREQFLHQQIGELKLTGDLQAEKAAEKSGRSYLSIKPTYDTRRQSPIRHIRNLY